MKNIASIFIRQDLTKEEKALFYKELMVAGIILGLFLLFIVVTFCLGLFIDDFSQDRYFEGKPIDYLLMIVSCIFFIALLCSKTIFFIKRKKLKIEK